jgi:hypothetical protein
MIDYNFPIQDFVQGCPLRSSSLWVQIVYYKITTIWIDLFEFHKKILNNVVFSIILNLFLLINFVLCVVQFQIFKKKVKHVANLC